MLEKIKQKLKGLLTKKMYRFLMREAQYGRGRKPFGPEELQLLTEALVSQNLFGIDGKMVGAFETEFAKAYGVPYAVASTSGTAAIHTALGALDLNPGDEVITAPVTDLGTIIPILYQQAILVFADCDETLNMDPVQVEDRSGHDRRYAIDSKKIQKELGWRPSVDFAEGLDRTIQWYVEHEDWLMGLKEREFKVNEVIEVQ